jgi:DNA mismatch repair ATPase MutS
MVFNSLLWLPDSIKHKIDARVIVDLGLDTIYGNLMSLMGRHEDYIINELCFDEKTIYYRQGILKEFMNTPNLLTDLIESLKGIIEINKRLNNGQAEGSQFYQLVNLVIQIEAIIECMEALQKNFERYEAKSEGLNRLKEIIISRINRESFNDMKRHLDEMKLILSKVKSIEISANISVEMRPLNVQITEINKGSYDIPEVFSGISEANKDGQVLLGNTMMSYCPIYELEYLNWDVLDDLAYAFKPYKDKFAKFIQTYQYMDVRPFQTLIEELTFYQGSVAFSKQLIEAGLSQCMPVLLNSNERRMEIKGFYNINTVLDKIDEGYGFKVVTNDLLMDKEARIFILTGANRGGKTTLTQAIGQIQVLTQLGLYIPAKEAKLSLVDYIFTHFSVKENETVDLGRLGKECQMFSDIFQRATEKSLLLLNESFSGTSHLESLKIGEEAVMATKYRRMRMIFNTHLHELAIQVNKYNASYQNDTKIVSLVIGNTFDRHSYKIHIGEPLGKSFAREEAERYGVTYEQLTGKGEVNHYGKSNLQFVVV